MVNAAGYDLRFNRVYWIRSNDDSIALDFTGDGEMTLWFASQAEAERQLNLALELLRKGRDPRAKAGEGFFRYASGYYSCKHLDCIQLENPKPEALPVPVAVDDDTTF